MSSDKANRPEESDRASDETEAGPSTGTSEKQIRANRENAKKATGPKTEAGKARSSQNARTHGIFQSRIEPVRDGSYVEDPGEFYERVQSLIDSMGPRDPVEMEVATRRAGILVKLERLDRWMAASISGTAVMSDADLKAGARSEYRVRLLAEEASHLALYLSDPDLVTDPRFETMAAFVRYHGPQPNMRIEGFWDDENTPANPDEWRRALEALVNAVWESNDKAAAWAHAISDELWKKFERVESLEERIAANRILSGPFELGLKYEARLLNRLRIVSREYEALQERDLGMN